MDNTNACTLAQDPSAGLAYTGHIAVSTPLDGPTMGLMMLLSTFQYQAPYMNPTYSQAASQAGKAASIVDGGQAMQDRATAVATDKSKNFAYSLGLTDMEIGIVLGTAKTIRNKQLNINGPKIYSIKTHLTITPQSGNMGFKYEW